MKRSHKTFFALIAAALISAAAHCPVLAEDAGEPQIAIEQPHYEFPAVAAGQVVAHDFIVKNNGTGTLKIAEVKTG